MRTVCLIVISVVCLHVANAQAMTKTATVHPIDGDSIRLAGIEMRLQGIDAPEWKQRCRTVEGKQYACGEMAAAHLRKLVKGKQVKCRFEQSDRYGRKLATCTIEGVNLNEMMARDGWALAYRHYSTAYIKAEELAKKDKLGIWAGSFQKPWEWRNTGGRH